MSAANRKAGKAPGTREAEGAGGGGQARDPGPVRTGGGASLERIRWGLWPVGEGSWGQEGLSKCRQPQRTRGHKGKERAKSRSRNAHQDRAHRSQHRKWPATRTLQVKARALHDHTKGTLKSVLSSVCHKHV